MMREWGRMVVTGTPPFPVSAPLDLPALIISLDRDELAPVASIDAFAERMFNRHRMTRWHFRADSAVEGTSDDHIGWVRGGADVVTRIVDWWNALQSGALQSTTAKESTTHD